MIRCRRRWFPGREPIKFGQAFWEAEEEHGETALDSSLGRILCIGYCEEDVTGKIIERGCFGLNAETKSFERDERLILAEFRQYVRGFQKGIDLLIGHNILAFDLPFIIQRSVIHGIKPTVKFDLYKYQKSTVFDTMLRWDFYVFKKSTSLKKTRFRLRLKMPEIRRNRRVKIL